MRNSPTCVAVLIIEDDSDIRKALVDFLRREGFQVYAAHNGDGALHALSQMPRPALVLADLMMPGVNGAALLAALISGDQLATLPVVMVSEGDARHPAAWRRTKITVHREDLLTIVDEFCLRRT